MSLWGSKDQANNAPKYKIKARSPNTGIQLFGTSVVGLDDGEIQSGRKAAHAGWQRVVRGTGPVATITITAGGSGYANTDTINITGVANSSVNATNATATLFTNATGGIVNVTITSVGNKFCNNSTTTVTVLNANNATSAGSGATFTVTLGGRANRVLTETLVALSSMTANNSTL